MADRYDELSTRERMFVDLYLESMDPYRSALTAGFSRHTARGLSWSWIKQRHYKPALYDTIKARLDLRRQDNFASAEAVRHRAWLIATGDPRELVETRVTCCRYCHGDEHEYQWTLPEYEKAVVAAESGPKPKPMPDCTGGFDYRPDMPPHEGCPECAGEGVERIRVRDSRELSESALALLKRVKPGKYGPEVEVHDQQAAMKLYAAMSGFLVERKEVTGKDGAPLDGGAGAAVLEALARKHKND